MARIEAEPGRLRAHVQRDALDLVGELDVPASVRMDERAHAKVGEVRYRFDVVDMLADASSERRGARSGWPAA